MSSGWIEGFRVVRFVVGDNDKMIVVFGYVEGKWPSVECVIHFNVLCCGLGVVEGKSVEGKIIGNDQSRRNAR